MNMQEFYDWLSQKSSVEQQRRLANLRHASRDQVLDATREGTWLIWNSDAHQRRLANLTRVSRAQVLDATAETEWFVWHAEMPNT